MNFIPNSDILVAAIPDDVFADLTKASHMGIASKKPLGDEKEASIRQEYQMPIPNIFEDWITQTIDLSFPYHTPEYGIMEMDKKNMKIVQMWVNVMEKGDQHFPHQHRHSFYSFSCYISCTNDDAPFYFIKDNRGQKVNIDKGSEGHALIFPSTLIHTVYPKTTEDKRISVSGNIVLTPVQIPN
tara:strand:+ start:543 stop:1094 length:552 start_codon:yes stop_codon:yes gene_type:complete